MHAQVDQSDESEDDADVESTVDEDEPASDNEQLSSDEEEVDVWKVITDEADDEDGGLLEDLKKCIVLSITQTERDVPSRH